MGQGQAVVAGGSLAGMAVAQAPAETFGTVTLLERDDCPPACDGFRVGCPCPTSCGVPATRGRPVTASPASARRRGRP